MTSLRIAHTWTALRGGDRTGKSAWRSLFWKEMREHQGKMVVCAAFMVLLYLAVGASADSAAESYFQSAGLVSIAGCLFIAIAVVAAEREEGSLDFVHSLPIPRWQAGLIRIALGALACVAPLMLTAMLAQLLLFAGLVQGTAAGLWTAFVVTVGLALSLYAWVTAAAIDQPSQLRAGAVGVVVVIAWIVIGLLLTSEWSRHYSARTQTILSLGPSGWMDLTSIPPKWPSTRLWISQGLVGGLLLLISVAGYGRRPNSSFQRPWRLRGTEPRRIGPPRRSPRAAILWLQVWDALPIGIAGSIILLVCAAVSGILAGGGNTDMKQALDWIPACAVGFGFFWVVIVAVGTIVPNLQPSLMTFWRSQPLNPSEWFWSKYSLAALVSLACLHVPTMFVLSLSYRLAWMRPLSELAGYSCIVLMHLMVYSVAVLAACLVRRFAYAGLLSLSVAALLVWTPITPNAPETLSWLRFDEARRQLTDFAASGFVVTDFADVAFLPYATVMSVIIVVSSVAAERIVVRDIVLRGSR